MIEKININGVEYAATPVTEGEAANGVTVKVDGVTYLLGEPIVAPAVAPAASSGSQAIEKVQVNGVVYDIADVEGVEAEAQRAQRALQDALNTEATARNNLAKEIRANAMQYDTLGVYVRADKAEIYGRSIDTTPRVVEFPAATTEKAGVMSAEDKKKVNASIKDIVVNPNVDDVELDLEDNTEKTSHVVFPAATTEKAGVMSAEDKKNLDALPKAIAEEVKRAKDAERVNANAIADEITRATNAEEAIKQLISDLVGTAPDTLDTLQEIAEWINKDETGTAAMVNAISTNADAIAAEQNRAKAAEKANANAIVAEQKRTEKHLTDEVEKIKGGDTIVGQAREIHSRKGKTVTDSFLVRTTAGSGTIGDGVATTLASLVGAPANTTYGENTGVLNLSKVYDPFVVRLAAVFAIIFCVVRGLPVIIEAKYLFEKK